jgi:hypothetical protein
MLGVLARFSTVANLTTRLTTKLNPISQATNSTKTSSITTLQKHQPILWGYPNL